MTRLFVRPVLLKLFFLPSLIALAGSGPVRAQLYTVGPNATATPQDKTGQTQTPSQPLGWGSNLQTARLAHAAELALQRGDHALAVDYAQQAAQADSNDPQLWFLLGYAARLDARFSLSETAYNRGLRLNPSALEGLSGLAQTYSVLGRTGEAERLLKQVISSDPRRVDDVQLLGSLYLNSGDDTNATLWLRRAESIRANARAELLLALSYEHLKQMSLAGHYLDLAKHRNPDDPDVQRSLAGYYRETGSYSQAIAALRSIRSPKPDVVAELAYTDQLDGQLSESAKLYTQAADAMPKDLGLQLSAAQAQLVAGSVQNAEPFLQRAAALDSDHYRLHAIRGQIAQLEGHDEEAVREYTAALAHLPATPVEGPLYSIQLHMDLMQLDRNLRDQEAATSSLRLRKQLSRISTSEGRTGHSFCACGLRSK